MPDFETSGACIVNLTSPTCLNLNFYYRDTVVLTFLHSSLAPPPLTVPLPWARLGERRWATPVTKAAGLLSALRRGGRGPSNQRTMKDPTTGSMSALRSSVGV